jgi:hypothetical protein
MQTPRTPSFLRALPPILLAGSLFVIYWSTLAPDLSWANGGSDGGDLIAAAATGGVAHPTGYPLYLLLARLFQLLPVGTLAFRTNLMSALFAALAAWLVYEIVVRAVMPASVSWLAGLLSGLAFGLAPLVWSQAVITEVYTLQAFLTALVVYLYAKPAAGRRLDCWRGLALGLAASNHITGLLLAPAALLLGSLRRIEPAGGLEAAGSPSRLQLDRAALLGQLGMFAAGLSLYLTLPLRALTDPPVNWGNVVTPARLWWLVSGQLYQSYYLPTSFGEIASGAQRTAASLLEQLGLPAILLGLVGVIVFWKTTRLHALTVWTAVVHLLVAAIYQSPDAQVYLIPALLCFSVWAGLGFAGLTRWMTVHSRLFQAGLGILICVYFAARGLSLVLHVDASRDLTARSFAREVFSQAPQNAMIFARGDHAVFALWYYHFALGERPDLTVAADDLLHFDWYQETLRETYPELVVPGPLPWAESIAAANPSRIACSVEYLDRTVMVCWEAVP